MMARPLVLHVDVDAFFASVEQLLVPPLRGRPVIVGSGCIASCSYEARKLGLRAGMGLTQARKLCPRVIILEGNSHIYRCFAQHIWRILSRFTVGMETYLDEAYGDATGMDRVYGDALTLGRRLQQEVRDEVGLPVSVGLAANRMVAGIASHLAKPCGVAHVPPGTEETFLGPLPIEELTGIGYKTAQQLHDMNIQTVEQLRAIPHATMTAMLGRRGEILYERCRGRDVAPPIVPSDAQADEGIDYELVDPDNPDAGGHPPVVGAPTQPRRLPKSISRETTFHHSLCDLAQIHGMLHYLLERAMRTARQAQLATQCVEVRIRYDDFKGDAASKSLPHPTDSDEDVFPVAIELLTRLHRRRVALRHAGITLSRLSPRREQPALFDATGPEHQLNQTLDEIRDRFGHAAVVTGKSIELLGHLEQNDHGFVLRTPSLTK